MTASDAYPEDIAIECIDELYETMRHVQRKWGQERRQKSMDACCRGIATKYGTLDEGSAPHVMMNEEPTMRREYSARIKILMQEVDRLQQQMNENIMGHVQNMEAAERVQEKADECREMAKVFKKRAKKLRWKVWFKNHRGFVLGTALFSITGGVGGFLIGGPHAAVFFGGMASVNGAQALEATAGAIIFAVAFIGASSALESWFLNQKMLPLRGTGGDD